MCVFPCLNVDRELGRPIDLMELPTAPLAIEIRNLIDQELEGVNPEPAKAHASTHTDVLQLNARGAIGAYLRTRMR